MQDLELVDALSLQAIDIAVQNLIQFGAVTGNGHLIELIGTGRSLVKLGIEPRLGKLLLIALVVV